MAVEDVGVVIVVVIVVLVVEILPFFNDTLPPVAFLIGELSRSRKLEDLSRSYPRFELYFEL